MKLANLISLKPLKESSMQARELADRNSSQQLQSMYDQLMRDMEQEAEPEGGPIADQYADQMQAIEDAMQIKRGGSSRGSGPNGEMTYGDMLKKHYPNRMNEATEKSWNSIDVSRKAEKEIDNKEWNERTTKKLDMLIALNKADKFKKDWDEEKLQGWVDENYSWEKLARQFKLNESYSAMYEQGTIKKVVNLKMDSEIGEPVTVEYKPNTNLTDVTISWGNESHTVDFEAGDVIDDHGNEGMDIETMADSDDGRWQFILDVSVEASFPMTGDFADWDFDELIVQGHPDNEDHLEPEDRFDQDPMEEDVDEGSCGYTQKAPGGKDLKTPGGTKGMDADKRTMTMMREVIKKEIKKLKETSLDDKLKGSFSPEEWEKITSKKVPSFADMKPKPSKPEKK